MFSIWTSLFLSFDEELTCRIHLCTGSERVIRTIMIFNAFIVCICVADLYRNIFVYIFFVDDEKLVKFKSIKYSDILIF